MAIKTQMRMFLDRLPELFPAHGGKVIAVCDGRFMGEYPSKLAGWRDMRKRGFREGGFVVVECLPDESCYEISWITP